LVQVRGYTEDDVDVLADEFTLVIQASLQRAVAAAANNLTGAVTAASSAGLSPHDVSIVTTTWQDEVNGVLVPYVGEVYTGSATAVAVGLADGFPSEEMAGIPLIADEFQLTFMKSVTGSFLDIGDDVWEDCRVILVNGIKNGESIEQIAAKMLHVTDFTMNHATLVARTSVHSAAESGSIAQMRWMGYDDHEVQKEWLCTHDARTRPTHFHADKQKVPLNAKFDVGGSMLDFPGDPLGAADEVIQCRCTALFNIETPPKFRCDGLIVASVQTQASACVMPAPKVDTSSIDAALQQAIFAAFMKAKITPAYGGAKIHKVLAAVRAEEQAALADITDLQILKVVDDLKTGPSKGTFSEKYWEWLESPAGKKAVPFGTDAPTHVIAPIKNFPSDAGDMLEEIVTPTVVPPTPLGSSVGDISSFDYFFKQDVLDAWVILGDGKKVTPAWGGAKIWKLLGDLKAKVTADIVKTGMSADLAPSELQLLRILDDVGGFTGKPKTYEGELIKWLDSPAGKKAVPKPPASLFTQKPNVTPVVKPTAAATVAANDEISIALAATDNKVYAHQLFVEAPKYKSGDVIGYIKTANGDTLRVEKLSSDTVLRVLVRKDSKGETAFVYDSEFSDWTALVAEYNVKSVDKWSLIQVPKPKIVTKIAGKVPGDIVSLQEINDSKYLWKAGDVVATAEQHGYQYRLVSNGKGAFSFEFSGSGDSLPKTWLVHKMYFQEKALPKTIQGLKNWKLGSDVIESDKLSKFVPGASPGANVTVSDINAFAPDHFGETMAYAYDDNTGTLYRMRVDTPGITLEWKQPSGSWSFVTDKPSAIMAHGFKWKLAKNDGSMPDVISALIPGKKTPGLLTPTKYANIAVDQEVDLVTISNDAHKFEQAEILAYGKSASGTMQYRVYRVDGDWFALETKYLDNPWQMLIIAEDKWDNSLKSQFDQWLAGGTKWFATADKMTKTSDEFKKATEAVKFKLSAEPPAKVTPHVPVKVTKSTPATTPEPAGLAPGETAFPGKVVGDKISKIDIEEIAGLTKNPWSNAPPIDLPDGTVIATYKSGTSWDPKDYRVFVVDGKLVQQKKSKAGTWVSTKVIKSSWDLDGTYHGWVTANDVVPAPAIKAGKTALAKAGGTYVAPVKKASKDAVSKIDAHAGESYTPAVGEAEDISRLKSDDKLHIFSAFKGVSEGQLLSHSNESVFSNMWAWAVQLAKDEPGRYGNLTVLQVARAVDEALSAKLNKSNLHLFEKKMKDFMSSTAGREYISSGKYKLHKTVQEVFEIDLDTPPDIVLAPGQKVQVLPGPGPFDPSVPSSAFRLTTRHQMQDMMDKLLHDTRPWRAKERQALRNWTSGAYYSWNGYLRGISGYTKASPDLRAKILYGQAGMRPMPEDLLMKRGSGWEQLPSGYRSVDDAQKLVGKTFEDEGFFATSTSQDFGGFGGHITFEVEVPKGTMAAFVNGISHNKGENELLLAAGSRFHVISVKPNGYGVVIRVRVVS
jgi:hypothetical protein